jgi:type IV pilus assembly protein PilQ
LTVVEGIHVYEDAGKFLIDVKTNTTPAFKSFELDHPQRIVVDMLNARLNSDRNYFRVGKGNVKSIRLAQFSSGSPSTVRAVFTTGGKIDYTLQGEANAVRLAVPFEGKMTEKNPPPQVASVIPSTKAVLAAERPATIVRGINTRLEGNQLVVAIQADGVLQYKTFELDRPQRLVVDIASVNLRAPKRVVNVRQGDLMAVRLGQLMRGDSPVVRAVMDQSRKTPFKVESNNEGLKFFFPLSKESVQNNSKGVPSNPSAPAEVQVASLVTPDPVLVSAPIRESKVNSPESLGTLPEKLQAPARPEIQAKNLAAVSPSEVVPVEAQPERKRPPEATIAKMEEPAQIAALKESVSSVQAKVEPVPNTDSNLPKPAAISNPQPAPIQTASKESSTPVAPPPVPSVSAPYSADPSPKPPAPVQSPVATTATSAPQTAPSPAATATNPGDMISLDLRDVDLRDFFRLISEVSGLNVVLEPSVKGTLTIVLKDVPWEQALEIVLRNNQLGKQLEGNVLRIVSLKTLEEEQNARRSVLESQRAEEEAAARQTYVRAPNYLKAEDVKVVLEEMLKRGDVKGAGVTGSVSVFPKEKPQVKGDQPTERAINNFVVVYTTPKKMAELDALLKVVDVKSQQVEIEARVLAVNDNFLRDMGVQLGTKFSSGNNVIAGLPSLTGSSTTTSSSNTLPLNMDLGAASPTSGIGYIYTSAHALIDAYISASEARGTAKVLSRPKFVTQNYVKGVVTQGLKIPFQTQVNNTVTTTMEDAALILSVTPQITADGEIILDADVKNDTPDFSQLTMGQPSIQTQEILTKVRIRDGETVVIGGVMIDNNSYQTRQVPGLGSLPVIGNLFKNKSVSKTRQELLFFLTPKIIPDSKTIN